MRYPWLALAALMTFTSLAHAQIAAPRLNPLVLESFNPFNPAVLPWGGPSRIGAGVVDVEAKETISGVTSTTFSGDGLMAKAHLVGETFAFGAEIVKLDIEDASGVKADAELVLAGLAAQFGDTFSLGVGKQGDSFKIQGFEENFDLTVFGGTLRLGEVFYIGVATGTENVEFSFGGVSVDEDRTVTRAGVAYHTRNTSGGLHLEAYKETVDPITTPFSEDEEDTTGIALEVVFSGILIVIEAINTEFIDSLGDVVGEEDETIVSLGWVPESGLNVVVSAMESEDTETATGDTEVVDLLTVAVGWSF